MKRNAAIAGILTASLAVGLGACSKNELASSEEPGVFVEVERAVDPEFGASQSIATAGSNTRRVRLSEEDLAELERLGNAPRVAETRRASIDYCPTIRILNGTGVLTAYSGDGVESQQDIDHQATITRSGRECKVESGSLILRVGAAGRAIKGPKSASPTISLPIRIAVVRDENEVLFSELFQYPVVLEGQNAQGFSFVKEDVTIPFPERENLSILVGFDTQDGPLAARLGNDQGSSGGQSEG